MGHDLTTKGNHTATMDNRRCRGKTTEMSANRDTLTPRVPGLARPW